MKGSTTRRMLFFLFFAAFLMFAAPAFADIVTWTIKITPAGAGTVGWQTSNPFASGTIDQSGKISVERYANVVLTLNPLPAGSVEKVIKVGSSVQDITSWFDNPQRQSAFNGVGGSHTFYISFELPPDPSGDVTMTFPVDNPSVTAIANLSGVYTGTTASTKNPRDYNLTVAQDEAGKLTAFGTVDGLQQKDGKTTTTPTLSGNIGSVTTVDNKPTVNLKGSFAGSNAGTGGSEVVSSSGTLRAPAEVTTLAGGGDGVAGTISGSAKVAGKTAYTMKNEPISAPASTQNAAKMDKNWELALHLVERADAKGKKSIYATAELTLPNSDTANREIVLFHKEKKVTYSKTKGYKVAFSKGTVEVSPGVTKVDSKTKITITGLTFTSNDNGATWTPTGGTLQYGFYGQKGTANLLDFLDL